MSKEVIPPKQQIVNLLILFAYTFGGIMFCFAAIVLVMKCYQYLLTM